MLRRGGAKHIKTDRRTDRQTESDGEDRRMRGRQEIRVDNANHVNLLYVTQ